MVLVRLMIIVLLAAVLFTNGVSVVRSKLLSYFGSKLPADELSLENDSLKARLYILENLENKKNQSGLWQYLETSVFATYPFNNQNLISINAGISGGVRENDPVAPAPGILLGQIIKTGENSSLVRTIFDTDFKAAVKIGDNKINALLKGGVPPMLEMISKNSAVKTGDIVYNADPNFPYGFRLGEAAMVSDNEAGPFKKAELKLNYSPALLDKVLVVSNFENPAENK